jgi:ParB/RepB/Spo0J family partition protein
MSKTDDTTTSNVQGGYTILEVPITRVIPDPDRPNVRGRVLDTTDLQPSIAEYGILQPILVRPVPDKDGWYYRISGERRQVAAREVGLKTVPVIVSEFIKERDVRMIMLSSDLHKNEPHIVLDSEGNLIAGKCKAVYEELEDDETETTRQDIAVAMGVTSDVVGAYYMLAQDIPEVQRKVSREQMAITVYALIKHHTPDTKRLIVAKKGNITARYVRDALKNWDDFVDRSNARFEKENEELSDGFGKIAASADVVADPVDEIISATKLLTDSWINLSKIVSGNMKLEVTDYAILEQICSLAEEIENEN